MPEQMPANTIRLGENAYLIESPNPQVADCLVLAHGGSIDLTRKFTVPAGVTIHFYVDSGTANTSPDGGLTGLISAHVAKRAAGREIGSGSGRRVYPPGAACPDYILSKALGTHFESVASRATYLDVRNLLDATAAAPGNGQNWVPHVATVRNRTSIFRNKNMWLSTLVAEITDAKPAVTTIYCANCRSDVSGREKHFLKTVGRPALESAKGR